MISTQKDPRDDLIPEVLLENIKEALENEDKDTLKGLECFSAVTEWTELRGYAVIISALFNSTVKGEERAEKLDERIKELKKENPYNVVIETLEKSRKRKYEGWVRIDDVVKFSKSKSRQRVLNRILLLEKYGFIEKKYFDGDDWIRFTDMWRPYISDLKTRGSEKEMYVYSIGIMIGHAIIGEDRYKNKNISVKSLRVIMHVLNKVDMDGKIDEKTVEDLYLSHDVPLATWTTFKEKDNEKVEEIRAITSRKDGKIVFNREMIRVNELMNQRINQRLAQMKRETT